MQRLLPSYNSAVIEILSEKFAQANAKNNNKFMKMPRARGGNTRDKANIIYYSLPLSIYPAVGFAFVWRTNKNSFSLS